MARINKFASYGESSSSSSDHRISDMDVVMGRGNCVNAFAGNSHFRRLVDEYRSRYLASTRPKKREIATEIVKVVQSKGGKFVCRLDDTKAIEVGDQCAIVPIKRAVEKTCQALRELKVLGVRHCRKKLKSAAAKNAPSAKKIKSAKSSSFKARGARGVVARRERKGFKLALPTSKRARGLGDESENGMSQDLGKGDSSPPSRKRPRDLPRRAGLKRQLGAPKVSAEAQVSKKPTRQAATRKLGARSARRSIPLRLPKKKLQALIRRPGLLRPQKLRISIKEPTENTEESQSKDLADTSPSRSRRVAPPEETGTLVLDHNTDGGGSSSSPRPLTTIGEQLRTNSRSLTINTSFILETAAPSLVRLNSYGDTSQKDFLSGKTSTTFRGFEEEKEGSQQQLDSLRGARAGCSPLPFIEADRGTVWASEPPLGYHDSKKPVPSLFDSGIKIAATSTVGCCGQEEHEQRSSSTSPSSSLSLGDSGVMREKQPALTSFDSSELSPGGYSQAASAGQTSWVECATTKSPKTASDPGGACLEEHGRYRITPTGPPRTTLVATSIKTPRGKSKANLPSLYDDSPAARSLSGSVLEGSRMMTPQPLISTRHSKKQHRSLVTPVGPPFAPALSGSSKKTPLAFSANRSSHQQRRSFVTPTPLPPPAPSLFRQSSMKTPRRVSSNASRPLFTPTCLSQPPTIHRVLQERTGSSAGKSCNGSKKPQEARLFLLPSESTSASPSTGDYKDNDSEQESVDISCISCNVHGESGCTCPHSRSNIEMMTLPSWLGRDVVVDGMVNTSPMTARYGGTTDLNRVIPPRRVSDVGDHYIETNAPRRSNLPMAVKEEPVTATNTTVLAEADDPWDKFVSGRFDII